MVSVNQVRHMLVVNDVVDATPTTKGNVKVCTTKDGDVYLQYMGEGGLITSDLIKKNQLISATKKEAADARVKMKEAVLALPSGTTPVAGENYIVDIIVSNYISMSEESVLVKFGAVHATSGMTASAFYVALAKSFARNFSREVNKFFKFYLTTSSGREEVTTTSTHAGTAYTGIVIAEQPQTDDYVRGEFTVYPVNFKVIPHTIASNGAEVVPFTVEEDGTVALTDSSTLYVGNGYELADTEYFCMGERGDQIRQAGYPRTIRTKYMVDPTQEYDVIDIAFYFVGRGVDAQKSDKMLTLVITPSATASVISDLNDALDTTLS